MRSRALKRLLSINGVIFRRAKRWKDFYLRSSKTREATHSQQIAVEAQIRLSCNLMPSECDSSTTQIITGSSDISKGTPERNLCEHSAKASNDFVESCLSTMTKTATTNEHVSLMLCEVIWYARLHSPDNSERENKFSEQSACDTKVWKLNAPKH